MLSWQTYAVLIIPGLGLFACGQRRMAGLVWTCLFLVCVQRPLSYLIGAAVVLQLLGILFSLRHGS